MPVGKTFILIGQRSTHRDDYPAFNYEGSPHDRRIYVRIYKTSDGTGLLERVGTGLLGTIGYVILPTGVSTDVSRDIV